MLGEEEDSSPRIYARCNQFRARSLSRDGTASFAARAISINKLYQVQDCAEATAKTWRNPKDDVLPTRRSARYTLKFESKDHIPLSLHRRQTK